MQLLTCILLVLCFDFVSAKTLYFRINESKTINVPKYARIHIGHKDIAKVIDLGEKIQIQAKKLGKTTLSFKNETYTLIVQHKEINKLFLELHHVIKSAKGLHLNSTDKKCSIQGELLSLRDWVQIFNIQKEHNKTCDFKARIHFLIADEVQRYHQNRLAQMHFKNIYFEITDGHPSFFSPKLTKSEIDKYSKEIKKWGLSLKVQHKVKEPLNMVQVKLLLAEISRSKTESLGLKWSQNYQAQVLPGEEILGNWMVELNAMQANGQGRILASPTLVAESGGKAEFLAGGEFPIRNQGFRRSQVTWKKHGLLFKIQPVVDNSQRIFVKIESEVSMIDSNNSVDGIPGLKVSRLLSQFNLDSGQTIALSGLIQSRQGLDNSGLPFLQNVPILGSLFSSKNFQQHKSELVIFVQPNIFNENQPIDFPKGNISDEPI